MQIESLKVFCDLVETKSFTKAAQINEVTQSAVSQTISALERRFKALLIERSKKNFRLTQEGEVCYDYAKQILQIHDALQSKLQEIEDVISGNIRLATVYTIGLHVLPPCVKHFLQLYPTVNVHVEYRRANQVYESVIGNVVDLGLVAYPVRDPKVEIVPLRSDKLALICHPQHALAKRKSARLSALNGAKFIHFEPDQPTRKAVDRLLREHHVAVQPVMEMDNIETLKRAVEIDSGVAIVPEETVRQEVANQTLAMVQLDGGDFSRSLAAIHKKSKVLSPALKRFIALLKKEL
ncbi:MAG TPA: LysR family transcriptional regulator [Candidatus Acidoferrum sp.]|nr:LysR family transcriptional regulator [Candidatus Acidoferrum sp.]